MEDKTKLKEEEKGLQVRFGGEKNLSEYNILQIILISIRSAFIILTMGVLFVFQKYMCPLVFVPIARRYLHSVSNLVAIRIVLLLLGFIRFTYENYRFFTKDPLQKITLKSGYVGIASHHNIIDFLFYSYLFNPVFVKLIIYKRENTSQILYSPLTFSEAFFSYAFNYRGFQPCIVQNQKEFKQVKHRKMALKTLISECFEEIQGPIIILSPGLHPKEHIRVDDQVAQDIFQNQERFQRSGVGIILKFEEAQLFQSTFRHQKHLLFQLMSSFKGYEIFINFMAFRKMKSRYDKWTYGAFIDEYFQQSGMTSRNMSYQQYLRQLDQMEAKDSEKHKKLKEV